MTTIRTALILVRHLYRVWRGGQMRFRLETFGLYYPDLPYSRPWWRLTPWVTVMLIRRLPSYARWVEEMEVVTRGGAPAWWSRYRSNAQ